MPQIYFSHSYRDRDINEHFLRLFGEHDVKLVADRKSKTWCVPKLECYMNTSDGFVAVVPQRKTEDGELGISPYIMVEIEIARRAGLPSLLIVDEVLLSRFPRAFPDGALAFSSRTPAADEGVHRRWVARFCAELHRGRPLAPPGGLRRCALFLGPRTHLEVSRVLTEMLEAQSYQPQILEPSALAEAAHDLQALEALWTSEFAVFALEAELSQVDVALALAHALCRPSFRLRHSPHLGQADVSLKGVLRWRMRDELIASFQEQLESYRRGFVETILREPDTSAVRFLGDLVPPEWDLLDPLSLVTFVEAGDLHLRNDLHAIRRRLGGFADLVAEGRAEELCRAVYDQVVTHDWLYDFEPGSKDYSRQRIRKPREMYADRVGTCLDFACLFGALLENMQANPVVVLVRAGSGRHALAGSWQKNRRGTPIVREEEMVRDAVRRGELVLFETTGAARSRNSVAGEVRPELGILTFDDAREAARQLLARPGCVLDFVLDVLAAR